MTTLLDRIAIDPQVCFGKPCIKGTRIWVSLILDFLASGESEAQILAAYRTRTDDIRAALPTRQKSRASASCRWRSRNGAADDEAQLVAARSAALVGAFSTVSVSLLTLSTYEDRGWTMW